MTTDLATLKPLIEDALAQRLSEAATLVPQLGEAMRYAVLGRGKRIRPLLTCATAVGLGAELARAMAPACAVEFVHAYSLIHDDLPAMDDDDLRRGRATVHVAYDEATAILAGDALQALAFETIAGSDALAPDTRLAMVGRLAAAIGWRGMVGGQALDMAATGRELTLAELETMHRAKTGALLEAAVDLGALCVPTDAETRAALADFAAAIGLAFQVVDDLLDVTRTTEALGKRAGADRAAGKNTYPALLGTAAAERRAQELHDEALAALSRARIASGPLHVLARQIVERDS
jgi:geranylgeranyl diphosphate synthase type II